MTRRVTQFGRVWAGKENSKGRLPPGGSAGGASYTTPSGTQRNDFSLRCCTPVPSDTAQQSHQSRSLWQGSEPRALLPSDVLSPDGFSPKRLSPVTADSRCKALIGLNYPDEPHQVPPPTLLGENGV